MQPTTEQSTILTAAVETNTNLMLNALAGCGKSTTLRLIERAVRTKPVLYLAFNKKVVSEIEHKAKAKPEEAAKRMQSTTTVRTLNSLGHRIWAGTTRENLVLNSKKTNDIFKGVVDEVKGKEARDAMWEVYWSVVQGVATAKSIGYVPDGKFPNARRLASSSDLAAALDEAPDDLTADLIDLVLFRSIQAAYKGSIDFNDQVYMPALFGGIFPQFPLVAVDEYQDLNPVNHAMLDKLVRHRIIGVGDPWQNIYGFRGAKQGGMAAAVERFGMQELDLSVSFRCPRAIVENARWRVPHFKWMKEGGHVEALENIDFTDISDNATIIARNNAPLFRTAFKLLAGGRSVSVAGSDIGPKLVGIMRRLGSEDTNRDQVKGLIAEWLAQKTDRGSTTAADLAACMMVFADHGSDLGQAIRYAEHLFAQTGSIRLMTGHKAKGLEFPVVYHLDSFLCRDNEQDMNLRYVIDTRAQERLYYIDSENIRWQ